VFGAVGPDHVPLFAFEAAQVSVVLPFSFHSETISDINELRKELENTWALAIVAFCVALLIPTIIKAERMPIIAITTSNSIKVKDLDRGLFIVGIPNNYLALSLQILNLGKQQQSLLEIWSCLISI
jgi:hypothetical protein